MNNFFANAFSRLVGLFSGLALVGSIVFGVLVYTVTGGWRGWSALIGAPLLVVVSFGSLSLLVQTNALLKQIARNTAPGASDQAGEVKGVGGGGDVPVSRKEPSLGSSR